jgi:PTH2 family peptidyl-tRNA hydrolase
MYISPYFFLSPFLFHNYILLTMSANNYWSLISVSLISFITGYWLARRRQRYKAESRELAQKQQSLKAKEMSRPSLRGEFKMVLVIRTDLGMSKGKVAAQCCHAAVGCYKKLSKTNPEILRHWERLGQAKITLKCNNEQEL